MKFVCDGAKNTACEQNTCLCDVELANQLIENLDQMQNAHTNSAGFDVVDSCVAGSNAHAKPSSCCGAYPKRFPFHSKGLVNFCLITFSQS